MAERPQSLKATYEKLLQDGKLTADPNQARMVSRLEALSCALRKKPNRFSRFLSKSAPRGLYFWGGVGVGKTLMMDLFYETLPLKKKKRMHFHAFMTMLMQKLQEYRHEPNPLRKVIKEWRETVRVFCFDEFFVTDITVAMLLAKCLEAMFEEGMIIVTTSNVAPDKLYWGGVARESFLPAIDLIKSHLDVMHVDSETDYRYLTHTQSGVYYQPLGEATFAAMTTHFDKLTAHHEVSGKGEVIIQSRPVAVLAHSSAVIWFEAQALLAPPRCARDYLEIATTYSTVFVSGLHPIAEGNDNFARNFINLVDVFYDNHVILVCQAQVPIDTLYHAGRLHLEFARTMSRLHEMQSADYLKG